MYRGGGIQQQRQEVIVSHEEDSDDVTAAPAPSLYKPGSMNMDSHIVCQDKSVTTFLTSLFFHSSIFLAASWQPD